MGTGGRLDEVGGGKDKKNGRFAVSSSPRPLLPIHVPMSTKRSTMIVLLTGYHIEFDVRGDVVEYWRIQCD